MLTPALTWLLGYTGWRAGGCEFDTMTLPEEFGCRIVVIILGDCCAAPRNGATSRCWSTWPGLTTVAPGVTILTWLEARPGRTWVCTVGVPLATEKTMLAGGGRIPSIVSSFVTSE
jgi:hypothetical protein